MAIWPVSNGIFIREVGGEGDSLSFGFNHAIMVGCKGVFEEEEDGFFCRETPEKEGREGSSDSFPGPAGQE